MTEIQITGIEILSSYSAHSNSAGRINVFLYKVRLTAILPKISLDLFRCQTE